MKEELDINSNKRTTLLEMNQKFSTIVDGLVMGLFWLNDNFCRKTRKLISQESFPTNRFGQPSAHLDPACNPDKPVVVSGELVLDAAHRIKGGIIRTQCSVSMRKRVWLITVYLLAVKNVEVVGNAAILEKRLSPENGQFQRARCQIQCNQAKWWA